MQMLEEVVGGREFAGPNAPPAGAVLRRVPVDSTTGWHLGDALGSAATGRRVDDLLEVCQNTGFGTARQMPVAALGRFKRVSSVDPALLELIHDSDVGLHAMSALPGAAGALPYIEQGEHANRGNPLGSKPNGNSRSFARP